MSKKIDCVRVVLSSGKKVVFRQMKISDSENAAMMVAGKARGDQTVMSMLMQKELVKMLLVSINDKMLSGNEKEDMDGLFTISEYAQVLKAIGKLSGSDDMGELKLEMVVAEGSQSPA